MIVHARGPAIAALSAAVVLLSSSASVPLHAQRVTLASVDALRRWVDAVDAHVPGQPDAAVRYVDGMTYAARLELNGAFPLFMRVLREERVAARSEFEAGVTERARTVLTRSGLSTFLKRAAVLHADASVFAGRFPRPPDDAPPMMSEREPRFQSERPPPLLTNEGVLLTRDGEVLGNEKLDWNLPFARSLLDLLMKDEQHPVVPRQDVEFVAAWYHAVAAFFFSTGMNADALMHLEHGARVLPDDPRVQFDRGTLAEWFGLPIHQVLADRRVVGEDRTNSQAERHYRRVLQIDPSYVEARVRLARLLQRRGRLEEAATEIEAALAARPGGVVAFYARIIAGRVASARGRYDEALRFYREALALHGRAQSALLGASHAALMLANAPDTLAPLASLGVTARDADPWLDYGRGAGRDADALLAQLWARSSKL